MAAHRPLSREILAKNLGRLLCIGGAYGLPTNQSELSRRSGVAQKTISNWLDPSRGIKPVLENLDAVAAVYGLEVWQLLVPDLPDDLLLQGHLKKLVADYGKIKNPAARLYIDRIAEAEAAYDPDAPSGR